MVIYKSSYYLNFIDIYSYLYCFLKWLSVLEVDFLMCIRILICMLIFGGSSFFFLFYSHFSLSSSFVLACTAFQGLQTRIMHYTGTSRILFHISIGVISKAITEHDPDPSYMIIFSFLSAQPRYNSRKAWQPFSACFTWLREYKPHFLSLIHLLFFSSTTHEQKVMLGHQSKAFKFPFLSLTILVLEDQDKGIISPLFIFRSCSISYLLR